MTTFPSFYYSKRQRRWSGFLRSSYYPNENHLPQRSREIRRKAVSPGSFYQIAPMAVRISFAKAIIKPPKRQRKPCVLWLASWDWIDIPTCTMPQPRMITPSALMMLKIKSERLLTISSGSPPAAIAGVTQQRQRAAAPAAVQ